MKNINEEKLNQALNLLDEYLSLEDSLKIELVVCGGAALIATNLVSRVTKDIDIVALLKNGNELVHSEPLPNKLIESSKKVAKALNLPKDWINNGPGSLFDLGFPEGFIDRFTSIKIGESLVVHFIGRKDQIFFKIYASVDRGGYHVEDLLALKPTDEEIIEGSLWSMTHDVSEGYKTVLIKMLKALGFEYAARRIEN